MKGFPKVIKTKKDVLNLLSIFPSETKEFVRKLMDERKAWIDGEYKDAPFSPFFSMGFTEAEGLQIVPDYVDHPIPEAPMTPEEIKQKELEDWRNSTSCGPLQFRRALRAAGLMTSAKQMVNALPEEDQEAWEYASVFNRTDPLILSMQAQMGKTDAEADDLFRLALTFK